MIALLLSYWIGTAPWCRVDNFGNGACVYQTLESCRASLVDSSSTCVLNQRKG